MMTSDDPEEVKARLSELQQSNTERHDLQQKGRSQIEFALSDINELFDKFNSGKGIIRIFKHNHLGMEKISLQLVEEKNKRRVVIHYYPNQFDA